MSVYKKGGVTIGVEDNPISEIGNIETSPNPASSYVILKYNMENDDYVNIKLFNITGQEISVLLDEYQLKGENSIKVNTNNYQSGIYLVKIFTNNKVFVEKIIILN